MRLLTLLAVTTFAAAQTSFQYDNSIPTETQVLGHAPGARISSPAEILGYLRALQSAAPKRMRLVTYGRTWEKRELVYAVIGSEANLARLDQIQSSIAKVADPHGTDAAEASRLVETLPATVWLAYGVHGNEISSPDAALLAAYHLLAARNDDRLPAILSNVLVFIDPLQNPDGRNRFVQNFESAEGLQPDEHQYSAEHDEPWPGGRTNHYMIDMNRDWFALTQPETRGRVAVMRAWLPLVVADLHEMGSNSTYYFAPEANPYNPYITPAQKNSLEWFGEANARYFDRLGISFFSKEGYDEFYPGYGASWPLYYGGIGMTYEQGSTRGLVVRKSDGTSLEYKTTVERHFFTSLATLETASNHRAELWANFRRYREEAFDAGRRNSFAAFVLAREGDVSAADKLASNLARQGIAVQQAGTRFESNGQQFPQGSFVIPLAQPAYRLVRALLDAQVTMDSAFLEGEEARRKAREPSEMYDVTAWSLPLTFGVRAVEAVTIPNVALTPVTSDAIEVRAPVRLPPAAVAYLVPWGTTDACRMLTSLLREHVRVASTDRAFEQNGRVFPPGTLIVKTKENTINLTGILASMPEAHLLVPANSSWVDSGPNFGSRHVAYFPANLHVAMAWDDPTSPSSAGAARFIVERELRFPVTAIRTARLASTDLSDVNTLLLPDSFSGGRATYENILGQGGVRRLRTWVENGGTLVALGAGPVSFLSSKEVDLLSIAQENAAVPEVKKTDTKKVPDGGTSREPEQAANGRVPGRILNSIEELNAAVQPENVLPDALHGVLLRAKMNRNSWLAAGVPDTVHVMVTGRSIFEPIRAERGLNAAVYDSAERLLASGFMWDQNRRQLAFKPFVVSQAHGRGNIVAFTSDPTFRANLDGLYVLLTNAIFSGPRHALSDGALE